MLGAVIVVVRRRRLRAHHFFFSLASWPIANKIYAFTPRLKANSSLHTLSASFSAQLAPGSSPRQECTCTTR